MGNKGKPELPPLSPSYAHAQNLEEKFLKFLQYLVKKGELSNVLPMRSGSTYTIEVSYNQFYEFNDVDLIMETCNRLDQCESLFLPAAHLFLRDRAFGNDDEMTHLFLKDGAFGNDDEMINKTCLSFIDLPTSVQKYQEFILNDKLFQPVQVFSSYLVILATTRHGRLSIQMLMVALLDYHSKGISWDGTFDMTDMVVIDDGHAFKQLKILKKPVEADKCMERMHEAMVKDLRRVSELIIPFYKAQDGAMPVYFSQLKGDLDGATNEFVAKAWFGEYLRSHVALMPSTARRYLETMLHATCEKSDVGYIPFLLAKPTVYPIDWRRALMKLAKKDINGVLSRVYSCHHQVETDQYENSVRGLMRFKSNFLEQGGQGQVYVSITETELELYAANMFDEFLPSLVFTLLKQGLMESVFGEEWKYFKELRLAESDP